MSDEQKRTLDSIRETSDRLTKMTTFLLCEICGVGFQLPSGKCDHCNCDWSPKLAPSREWLLKMAEAEDRYGSTSVGGLFVELDDEPHGSCDNCGTNLYADDDDDLCSQCEWAAAMGFNERGGE